MSLKIGIVGLPNVGKSTLFNALIRTKAAQASNYPFCTIDPNVGVVEVPDERLKKMSDISNSEKIIPTIIEFVDIAGLVKGASEGEGLGNKFLSHIRECNAICEVIRVFEDVNITHVHDKIEPKSDIATIETELILADLQTVDKRLQKAKTDSKSGDKKLVKYAELLEKIHTVLNLGEMAIKCELEKDEKESLQDLHLLTMKPLIYIANLSEDQIKNLNLEELRQKMGLKKEDQIIPICAKLEEDLMNFTAEEQKLFLEELKLSVTGLDGLIKAAYTLLNLITFFTTGPKETRAWTVKKGAFAPQAAGVIHTDFEKGFIKAEVMSYDDFINCGGETKTKEKGLLRLEGKNYEVKDGDIVHFKFNL